MTIATNITHGVQVVATGGALGAEIRGLDLSHPLPNGAVQRLRQALLSHSVIFFRNQKISEEDQVRFTNYFGIAIAHVRKQRPQPVKEIFIVSNVKENGVPIGALGDGEIGFHSDLSYLRQPGTISTLYAIELPSTGGATQWCNCYAAYEALDDDLKTRLRGLRAVHRHSIESQNPPEPVDHPVVCTHPETGRQALYVGPHLTRYIVGKSESESHELLEMLFAHLSQPRFVWTHDWKIGDLVVWDNRCTMHRRAPFPPNERRMMKRTQVF
ncbi:MAG: TauD/TfdA family dioxygenase, partial [Candidatus Poribacteria bacterium]|nr:TauD/TfdA family dioxygenase [Candidatus Poribacteria bacterium]